ncbi:MAG: hypothetical protein LBS11_06285 [Oscillospiraceae bacterium]|nr:hypothetical protein [Oscillospiraceae bacterium]
MKSNTAGIVSDLNSAEKTLSNLVGEETERQLNLKIGFETPGFTAQTLKDAIGPVIQAGLTLVESEQHNAMVSVNAVFGESQFARDLSSGVSRAFTSMSSDIAKAGETLRGYIMKAFDSGITPEEAAKIAALIEEYNAAVEKAIADNSLRAKIREVIIDIDGGVLDKTSVRRVANLVKQETQTSLDALSDYETRIKHSIYADPDIDVEEARRRLAVVDAQIRDMTTNINLEPFVNSFNYLNDHLDTDGLEKNANEILRVLGEQMPKGYREATGKMLDKAPAAQDVFKNIFPDLAAAFEKGAREATPDMLEAARSAMEELGFLIEDGSTMREVFETLKDYGAQVPEALADGVSGSVLDERVRESMESMYDGLKPQIDDVRARADEYRELGQEIPKELADSLKAASAMEIMGSAAENMWRALYEASIARAKETGESLGEAMDGIMGEIAAVASGDLALNPKAAIDLEISDEEIEKTSEQVARKLGEGTVQVETKADLDVEVTSVNSGMANAGEEGKQAYNDAMKGAGEEAIQTIADGMETEKDTILDKGEAIAAETVEKFLETLSAVQAAEIAKSFGDGIVDGLRDAYDRVLEIWNEFPKEMSEIFKKAKADAYNAFKPIIELTRSVKRGVVSLFNSLPDDIGSKFEEAAKRAEDAFGGLAEKIAGQMSRIRDSIAGMASAGNSGGDVPARNGSGALARNAVGGMYDSPTETMVGEEGRREYIIPTAYPDRAFPMMRTLMSDMGVNAESLQRANSMLGGGAEAFARPAQMRSMINNNTSATHTTTNTSEINAPVNVTVMGYGDNSARIGNQINSEMRRHIRNLRGRIVTA